MRIDIRKAFTQEPAQLDFVLPGLLAGTVGTLFSPGATGKSFLLLEAAMGIACAVAGGDLLGLRAGLPSGRRVAYLAAEDGVPVLEHRIHAIGQHLPPAARDAIADALDIECMVGRRFNIMDDRHLRALTDFAAGARLLVIDTISRVHQLDENSASDMARLLGNLEFAAGETSAAVVFAQHVAKSATRDGQGDQQHAARGSSVLTDNARWGAALTRMTEIEGTKHGVDHRFHVRMSVPKNNYSQPIADRWFRREAGGVLVPAHLAADADVGSRTGGSRSRNAYRDAKDGFTRTRAAPPASTAGGDDDWE